MRFDQNVTRQWLAGSCITMGLLAGCASPPMPKDRLAVGQSSIEAAQTAGAGETAPVELNRAREKMSKAQMAMQKKDYLLARRLANEAIADAQVARSKANATRSVRAADEISASLKTLRDQLNQAGDAGLMPTAPAAGQAPRPGEAPAGAGPQENAPPTDMQKQER